MYLEYLSKGPAGLTGVRYQPVAVSTTPYNIGSTDYENGRVHLVDATSGAITVNLPDATTVGSSWTTIIKKIDASINAITINRTGSATIDGQTSLVIYSQYDIVELVSNGTNWSVLNRTDDTFYSSLTYLNRVGGNFNTAPNLTTYYTCTTTLATAYTATFSREIVTSIQATNTSANTVYIDAYLRDALLSTDYPVAYQMPIPIGITVELLKKPKILYVNDLIKLKGDVASSIPVQMTVARYTATQNLFRGSRNHPIGDVTGYGTVYQETGTSGSVVESILLVNSHGTLDSTASVRIYDGVSNYYPLTFQMIIPAGGSIEVMQNSRFIGVNHEIQVQVGDANRVTTLVAVRRR